MIRDMDNQVFLNSSRLFTTKSSFSKGIARTFDLFGILDEYNYSNTGEEADIEALKRDVEMIGIDIANAMEEHAKTLKSNNQNTATI